jgi:uncharacterized protein YneF (UPF0154 family)
MVARRILGCALFVGVVVGIYEARRSFEKTAKTAKTAEAEKEEWYRNAMRAFGVTKGSPQPPVLQILMRAMEDEEIINARQEATRKDL